MKNKMQFYLLTAVCLSALSAAPLFAAVDTPIEIGDGSSVTLTEASKDLAIEDGGPAIDIWGSGGTLTGDKDMVVNITNDYPITPGGIQIKPDPDTSGVVSLGETHITTKKRAVQIGGSKAANAELTLGDNSEVRSKTESALYAQYGGKITVGDNARIFGNTNVLSVAAVTAGGGTIEIGDNAVIGNDGENGGDKNLITLFAAGTANDPLGSITVGDGSTIYSKGTGQDSNAVRAGGTITTGTKYTGTVAIGASADISTVGDNAYAVYSIAKDSSIDIGDGAYIHTTGKEAAAVRSGWLKSLKTEIGGTVTLGENAKIVTEGNGADGVGARGAGSNVTVRKGATIETTGVEAHGVTAAASGVTDLENVSITTRGDKSIGILAGGNYGVASGVVNAKDGVNVVTTGINAHGIAASLGGQVNLNGDINVQVDSSKGAYAIGAKSPSKSKDGILPLVSGDGVFHISGDIGALDGGQVDLTMEEGSQLDGAVRIDTSNAATLVELDMAKTQWNMTGTSSLSKLNLADSTVDMRPAALGSTLSMCSLSGNGNFIMKTDIAAQSADKIVSGNTDGSHKITVANQGDAAVTGDERVTLVETADQGGDFALTNKVELGAFQYDLRKNNDGNGQFDADGGQYWELAGAANTEPTDPTGPTDPGDKPDPSNPGSAAINTFVANYLLNYAETGTLMKRLGDLRDTPYQDGAWFRAYGGKFSDFEREYVRDFDMDYGGVQVGYDHRLENSSFKNGETYVGAFIGTSNGDLDFKQYGAGSGSVENRTMGMYATYIGNNGFYVDSVAKYVWSKNKYEVLDSANELVTGDTINTGGVGMSIEAGKRIPFGQKSKNNGQWYVEPQVQLSWQHQDGGSFHASNGLEIGIDGYDSLLGRAGVLIGYQADRTNFYAKCSYVKEFDGDLNITANGVDISESMEDNWLVYGVGLTRQMNDRNSIYLDAERSSGGAFEQEWALNAGWRISF